MANPRKYIYDASGRPVRRVGVSAAFSTAYDAASTGRRMKHYNPSSAAINALLYGSISKMRDRVRDQCRNVPWMRRACRSFVANVVGNGIRPIPKGGDSGFRSQVRDLWEDWAEECDADGRYDFYGLQSLVARSVYQSGEVLVRKIYRPRSDFDLLIPFQLKVLEADHLDHTYTADLPGGHRVVQGVEVDDLDRIVAYHIWRQHPGEMLLTRDVSHRIRVPAGEIIHIFEAERPGAMRGGPLPASAVVRMMDMTEYEDSEIVRKKFASMLMGFVTSNIDEDALETVLGAQPQGANSDGTGGDESEPFVADIEPGTLQFLDPGQEVKINEPADVGSSYEPFMKMNLRAGAAGADVMYEQMTGDLTGVNFSSIRWGLNEAQRIWEQFQNNVMIHQFCREVFKEFMLEGYRAGQIDAPDFLRKRRHYSKVKWLAPGWPYVNPQQEANADKIAIRGGMTSRTRVAARRGYDVNEIDQEVAADNARADDLGNVYDTDPRAVNSTGTAQKEELEGSADEY